MLRVILNIAAIAASVLLSVLPAKAIEVYMFKGAGDLSFPGNERMHFSVGLNNMADVLNAEGIHSEVRRFGATDEAYEVIMQRKPKSIALIGHSMGALASMAIAKRLNEQGIRIAYMGLIDIPGPVGIAGENVDWAENYYTVTPVFGLFTNTSTHPNAKNFHVPGWAHNRLDDAPRVQNGMLSAIRSVAEQERLFADPENQQLIAQQGTINGFSTNSAVNAPVSGQVASVSPNQTTNPVASTNIGPAVSPGYPASANTQLNQAPAPANTLSGQANTIQNAGLGQIQTHSSQSYGDLSVSDVLNGVDPLSTGTVNSGTIGTNSTAWNREPSRADKALSLRKSYDRDR